MSTVRITFDCDAAQFLSILQDGRFPVDCNDWDCNSFCVEVDGRDVNSTICDYDDFVDGIDSVCSVGSTYSEEWLQCSDSGDWYPCSDLRETPSGDYINVDSWYETYSECDDCGECVHRDNLEYVDDCGYCEGCACEHYHDGLQEFEGRSKCFGPDNSFGSSRSFGIELETNAGRCSESFAFDGKSDGSISGTEYVSHILRGDAGLAELKAFMDSGDGIEYDERCGVHIHMGCADLSRDELYAVYAAFVVSEDYFGNMFPQRMGRGYSDRAVCGTFASVVDSYLSDECFELVGRRTTRYQWINPSAYNSHGTLENRLHPASWNYRELSAWIILNLRFVRAARHLRIEAGETADSYRAKVAACIGFAESTENDLSAYYDTRAGQLRLEFAEAA